MPDDPTTPMEVLRDGYWEGRYPRAGDVIDVPASLVDTLTRDGFVRAVETPVATKGRRRDERKGTP